MTNNSLQPYGFHSGDSYLSIGQSIIRTVCMIAHYSTHIRSETELKLAMINADHEQKMKFLEILQTLAKDADNDSTRLEIHYTIRMLMAQQPQYYN